MSPSRADDPSLGVTRNSTSPLPCPEAGDNPEIQFTALDTVHPHSGCVAIDNLAAPPPASTTDGFASDTGHLTGSGPVPVTIVVEDALQPAVTAAATRTTATSRDGRRLTRTTFDAGLRIIADFRQFGDQSCGPRSRRARAIPLRRDLVQRRSAPAITITRSIWRPFLGRVKDIHQRSCAESSCLSGSSSRVVRRSGGGTTTVSRCQSGRGRRRITDLP